MSDLLQEAFPLLEKKSRTAQRAAMRKRGVPGADPRVSLGLGTITAWRAPETPDEEKARTAAGAPAPYVPADSRTANFGADTISGQRTELAMADRALRVQPGTAAAAATRRRLDREKASARVVSGRAVVRAVGGGARKPSTSTGNYRVDNAVASAAKTARELKLSADRVAAAKKAGRKVDLSKEGRPSVVDLGKAGGFSMSREVVYRDPTTGKPVIAKKQTSTLVGRTRRSKGGRQGKPLIYMPGLGGRVISPHQLRRGEDGALTATRGGPTKLRGGRRDAGSGSQEMGSSGENVTRGSGAQLTPGVVQATSGFFTKPIRQDASARARLQGDAEIARAQADAERARPGGGTVGGGDTSGQAPRGRRSRKDDSIIRHINYLMEAPVRHRQDPSIKVWKPGTASTGTPVTGLAAARAAQGLGPTIADERERRQSIDARSAQGLRSPRDQAALARIDAANGRKPSARTQFNSLFREEPVETGEHTPAEGWNSLFTSIQGIVYNLKEHNMTPEQIAEELIREAFTSGDRRNTTQGNGMAEPGGTTRQMLSGEFFGSVAWPFDQSTSPDFERSAQLQQAQAAQGQGEFVTGGGDTLEDVATEIVDGLLEDSPSYLYTDIDSVGYLIQALRESGYDDMAEALVEICKSANEEDVVTIVSMIEALQEEQADPFFVEQLTNFGLLLTEGEEGGDGGEGEGEGEGEEGEGGGEKGGDSAPAAPSK